MPEPVSGVRSVEDGRTEMITANDTAPGLPQACQKINARLQAFLDVKAADDRLRSVQEQTRLSLKVIEEALERYSLDELSISYNGGKDCLVLLILYLSALHSYTTSEKAATGSGSTNNHTIKDAQRPPPRIPNKLNSVYILSKDPFQQVDDFVDTSVETYHLSMSRYKKPMREGFASYLSDHSNIRAIFVGTRRTDPHGASLKYFDPTDRGWPAFMRIHPVIDWHYAEIWTFIRELQVPYCELYDLGYTSLGGTSDTHPNPALKQGGDGENGNGEKKYRPAYELLEDDAERLGRDWK